MAATEMSITALRASMALATAEQFLLYLEISHPDIPTPIRLVNDYASVTRTVNGQPTVYAGVTFTFSLPGDQEDTLPEVSVTIEDLDQKITAALRNASSVDAIPIVSAGVILRSSPDVIQSGPYEFELKAVHINGSDGTVDLSLGYQGRIMDEPANRFRATPGRCPGLF